MRSGLLQLVAGSVVLYMLTGQAAVWAATALAALVLTASRLWR